MFNQLFIEKPNYTIGGRQEIGFIRLHSLYAGTRVSTGASAELASTPYYAVAGMHRQVGAAASYE